jgi:drug/metabolite transporter (DMT)-like permease
VSPRTRAEIALLLTTLVWGGTFIVTKIGLAEIPPFAMIAARFTVAGLFYLAFFHRSIFPLTVRQVRDGALLALFLFLGFATQTVGMLSTTASKSAFITGMMVVTTPFLQVLLERRPPKWGNLAGILVVVTGLWLLTSPAGGGFTTGDALTLACAVFFGVYIVHLDIVSRRSTPVQLTFVQTSACALYALGVAAALEPAPAVPSGSGLLVLAYLAVPATIVTTFVQTRYQKDTTPTKAAVIFTLEPVYASVLAAIFLGETLGTTGLIGGALIVGGVLLSELSEGIPGLNRTVGWRRGRLRKLPTGAEDPPSG